MTEQHPITPSPELIEEWIELSRPRKDRSPNPNVLATYAARWGADQELEACCKWIEGEIGAIDPKDLFTARRPKPSSLKKQALKALKDAPGPDYPRVMMLDADQHALIRCALEALPDD